jgi:chromo domain-containing protein 1
MLTDLKGVAVTLQWIRNINKYKRRTWTLMLPPGILEWIERRLSDKKHSQDHGLYVVPLYRYLAQASNKPNCSLLLIHVLIIKNNATDARTGLFDEASLHLNSKSNVIAPSLNEYGTRTEHHDLKIKDKVERDADHLVEFFAGWSLINIPRFRNFIAVTSLGISTGPRWDKWGHMTVMRGGFAHFFKRFKIDSAGLMGYLSGGTKLQSSTSQATTPMTATTPQTPNWASHNSNASIKSTFTGSPNGNGTNKYPAPYK